MKYPGTIAFFFVFAAFSVSLVPARAEPIPFLHREKLPGSGQGFGEGTRTGQREVVDDPTCRGERCQKLRDEFRHVVKVGEEIYAYWELKRRFSGIDYRAEAKLLEMKITDDTDLTEYYRILQSWASSLRDGHVYVSRNGTPGVRIYSAPISLEVLAAGTDHERAVVSQVRDTPELKTGDEILEVNGVSLRKALDHTEKMVTGSSPQMRRYKAARDLVDAYGDDDGKKPLVLKIARNGKTKDVTLSRSLISDPPQEKASKAPDPDEVSGAKYVKAQILPGNIGYLRVEKFMGTDIDRILNEAMDKLLETEGLIIDFRNNGGGTNAADKAITSRLIEKRIVRFKRSQRMSKMAIEKQGKWFHPPSSVWKEGDDFADWQDEILDPATPEKRYLGKPVMVMTNPMCFSSCDTTVSALKAHKLATIVGEPTGGGTGGPLSFDLTYSGFRFAYSTVRGRTPKGEEIEGVGTSPDIVLEPTVEERVSGKDEQLQATIRALKGYVESGRVPPL